MIVQPVLLPDNGLLIGERWWTTSSRGSVDHVNAGSGKAQASILLAGPAEIDAAVNEARRAFPAWRRTSVDKRRDILFRIAALIREQADDLAVIHSLETGKPIAQTRGMANIAEWIVYYAGWIDKLAGEIVPTVVAPGLDFVYPEPYGVVGTIVPWNGPIYGAGMSAFPAIAAGNCVVLKPSELSPFSSILLGQIAQEAGLPPGVLNVVPGDAIVGDALVRHRDVDKLVFTGGAVTAEKVLIAAAASLTPVVLELGGKSANLVFPDADLEATSSRAVQLSLGSSSGQGCALPTRLLVHEAVYGEVVERVVSECDRLRVGMPLDSETTMGPVISQASMDRILGMIERAVDGGAGTLATGGARIEGELASGFFIAPTIFVDVDPGSEISQEEVFGPVLCVSKFRDEEEAVRLANNTRWGLAAFVHTNDLNTAHRVAQNLDAGYVSVNGFAGLTPAAPFGGVKDSGYGSQGGREGLQEFTPEERLHCIS